VFTNIGEKKQQQQKYLAIDVVRIGYQNQG
jgi:hypothetical protein